MRVMVLVKASAASERGDMDPDWTRAMLAAMGRFNEALRAAGILVAAHGLTPSARGVRVTLADGGVRGVEAGPFLPPEAQVAGFWLWQVRDLDEALAWLRRCPDPMPGTGVLEIRPLDEG